MTKHVQFTLSNKDINQYVSKNKTAVLQFCIAGNDYTSGRCLYLNGLFNSGLPLFAQSFEKILKAIIRLETTKKPDAGNEHSVYTLKCELRRKKQFKYIELDNYDDLLKKLDSYYSQRYPGNLSPGQSLSFSPEDLEKVDELWAYLLESIPFPVEVKYKLEFICSLFDERFNQYFKHYYWVSHNNKALGSKLEKMRNTFKELWAHLYKK